MIDRRAIFLLANLALSFYNVGTIWAHEVDIFRSWQLLDAKTFHAVQLAHWKKLPYWVLAPVALSLVGSIALVWYHPAGSPGWAIRGNLACQVLSLALTAALWGPWQAKLSTDRLGAESPFFDKILKTHWLRTFLITACAAILFLWTARMVR